MTDPRTCTCTHEDPDYRIVTYYGWNAPAGREWIARVQHPRTQLHIFFEAASEAEVIAKANAFWSERRAEREAEWARRDEAELKSAAAKAEAA